MASRRPDPRFSADFSYHAATTGEDLLNCGLGPPEIGFCSTRRTRGFSHIPSNYAEHGDAAFRQPGVKLAIDLLVDRGDTPKAAAFRRFKAEIEAAGGARK